MGFPVISGPQIHHLVSGAKVPVIIELWHGMQPACHAQCDLLEQLYDNLGDQVRIARLNVETDPQTAKALNTRVYPTLLIYNNGEEMARLEGTTTLPQLSRTLLSVIDNQKQTRNNPLGASFRHILKGW